ncbi:acyl-CoA dehydrogenase family protein [Streptomyces sp. PmtG]
MLAENYYGDLEGSMFASLATKVLASELMLESALDYQQLCGGEGYRTNAPDNIAAHALLDARVYTVFDGTNDLLCQHLAELFLREFQRSGLRSPLEFIGRFGPLHDAFAHLTDVHLSHLAEASSQDKIVILGRVLSRIHGISALEKASRTPAPTARLAVDEADYPTAIAVLKNEIVGLVNEYELAGHLADPRPAPGTSRPRATLITVNSTVGTRQ